MKTLFFPLLIFICVLVFLLLSGCQNREAVEVNKTTIDQLAMLLQHNNDELNWKMDLELYTYENMLFDPSKEKLKPFRELIERVRNNMRGMSENMRIGERDTESLLKLRAWVYMQNNDLLTFSQKTLRDNETMLALDSQGMRERLEFIEIAYQELQQKYEHDIEMAISVNLEILTTEMFFMHTQSLILANLLSCFTWHEYYYFPYAVNSNLKTFYEQGDTIEVDFGLGEYHTVWRRTNTFMIVDNDTIRMNKDGMFQYQTVGISIGKFEKELYWQVIDPQSREIYSGKSSFYYEVK